MIGKGAGLDGSHQQSLPTTLQRTFGYKALTNVRSVWL